MRPVWHRHGIISREAKPMPQPRPVVALTLGDPASVGPEVVVKALAHGGLHDLCVPVVVGDRRIVARALGTTGVALEVVPVRRPGEATGRRGLVEVVDVPAWGVDGIEWGRIQAAAGRAAFESICVAIELALAGEIDAVATAPVNKEAFRAAGVTQIGHTEIFGERTGTADPLTLFEVKGLRIFFLTRHLSLAEAVRRVTAARALDGLRRSAAALGTLGVAAPRVALAALNPHGGEHGLFGDEGSTRTAPFRPTPSSGTRPRGVSTRSSRSTTTRGTSPRRCTTSRGPCRSPAACRSFGPPSTTGAHSTSPGRAGRAR